MTGASTRLTAAVEAYFADLGRIRASGGATGERSSYGPLANLLNAVGATLKPKVFCVGRAGRSGRGPSGLRPVHGEAGAAGPPARGTDAGARGGGGEGGGRRRLLQRRRFCRGRYFCRSRRLLRGRRLLRDWCFPETWRLRRSRRLLRTRRFLRGRCVAHGSRRAGEPVLEPLPAGAGDEHARLRAGGRGRGGPCFEARNLPAGGQCGGLPPQVGEAARLRPRGRGRLGRVPVPGALASGGTGRAEGRGVAARLLCPGRSCAGGGGGRRAVARSGAQGAGRGARGALRGREGCALLPFDPGADAVLRGLLRLGAVGACRCGGECRWRRVIALRWRVIALRWRVIALRWRVIALRWRVIALRRRAIA